MPSIDSFRNAVSHSGYLRLGDNDQVGVKSKGFLGLKAAFSSAKKNKAVKRAFVESVRQKYGDDFATKVGKKIGVDKGSALSTRSVRAILDKAPTPRDFLEQNGVNLPPECVLSETPDSVAGTLDFSSNMFDMCFYGELDQKTADDYMLEHFKDDDLQNEAPISLQTAKDLSRADFAFDGEMTSRGEKNFGRNLGIFMKYCRETNVNPLQLSRVLSQEVLAISETSKVSALNEFGVAVGARINEDREPNLGMSVTVQRAMGTSQSGESIDGFRIRYEDKAALNLLTCGDRSFDLQDGAGRGVISQGFELYFKKSDLAENPPPFEVLQAPEFHLEFDLSKKAIVEG